MEKDTTEVLKNLPIPDFKSSDSIEELMNKYIQYLKDVEKARGLSEEKINVKYVHGLCRSFVTDAMELLKLMGKEYGQYKDYKATIEENKYTRRGTHWLLKVFDEKTGDTNGMVL